MVTIDKTQIEADFGCAGFTDIQTRFVDYSSKQVFQCRALFFSDDRAGGYTVLAGNLPGVVSEGDDLAAAIRNIKEAFAASIESYMEAGETIPWEEVTNFDSDPVKQLHFAVEIDG